MNESNPTIGKHGSGFKDITGQRFGKLTVLRYSHTLKKRAYWVFLCDCGKETITMGKYVRIGDTTSCGCAHATTKSEFGVRAKRVRGYSTWLGLLKRCYNTSDKDYPRYGERGITVCKEWREGFMNFFRDMGERPIGKTLDRKDNSKGYSKDNCQWSTLSEQARNRRNNTLITIGEETKCLVAWRSQFGISKSCYQWRVRNGWTPEKALITPPLRAEKVDLV